MAGVTLYGSINIEDAQQTRRLTTDLQRAAGRRIIIAVDQEGGQLTAAGPDTTPFAGNMALGAVGDSDLALRVADGDRARVGGPRNQRQLRPGGRYRHPPSQPVPGNPILRGGSRRRQPSHRRHGARAPVVRGGGHAQAFSRKGRSRRRSPSAATGPGPRPREIASGRVRALPGWNRGRSPITDDRPLRAPRGHRQPQSADVGFIPRLAGAGEKGTRLRRCDRHRCAGHGCLRRGDFGGTAGGRRRPAPVRPGSGGHPATGLPEVAPARSDVGLAGRILTARSLGDRKPSTRRTGRRAGLPLDHPGPRRGEPCFLSNCGPRTGCWP